MIELDVRIPSDPTRSLKVADITSSDLDRRWCGHGRELLALSVYKKRRMLFVLTNYLCCERCGPTLGGIERLVREHGDYYSLPIEKGTSVVDLFFRARAAGLVVEVGGYCRQGEHS